MKSATSSPTPDPVPPSPPAVPADRRGAPPGTVRTLKRDGRRGVFLVRTPDGLREVVKRWPATPWELVKLSLGIAQAQRQLRGARRLMTAGVATPRPRGGVRLTTLGGWCAEIRLEWVEGEPLLDRVRGAGSGADTVELARLGAAMGELLGRLRAAGLFHRDGKLSNFIVRPTGEIVAIDPVGVRRARHREDELARSMHSLACELSDAERAVAAAFLEAARLRLASARP